jgi:sirohydrochlorin ferrochelatase
MTTETILLVGRNTGYLGSLLETHAERLRRRTEASVEVASYEDEPSRELIPQFESLTAETVYAVPMVAAHTRDTTTEIPAALSVIDETVHYCEPVGRSPAITDVLAQRGATEVKPDEDASLVLVSFGSSSKPYQRETTDYHASRLEANAGYGAVVTCYLLQNPAVECVRYNVPTSNAVAVPLFLGRSEATERRIPAALELDRGGIEYADPLLDHPAVTDAIAAEVEKQRTLTEASAVDSSFEATLTETQRPVATDGDGRSRYSDN